MEELTRKLIDRFEVCKIIGISLIRFSQTCDKYPPHIRKDGKKFLYAPEDFYALDKELAINNSLKFVTFHGFMTGRFDRADMIEKYKMKKLASKYTKPTTTKVKIKGGF